MCTSGDSYITIDNYKSKKNRNVDDIRFEIKSDMKGPGVIMFALDHDEIHVGYNNSRLWYNIDLGTGRL